MGYKNIEQQREYQRQWRANRRNEFFSDKHCIKCGSIEQLQLDHVDPSQKISHNIWSWSKERRLEELTKCQILCYDCHLAKTRSEHHSQGIKNSSCKINPELVYKIRQRFKDGETPNSIGKSLNLHGATIRDIVYGRTWLHI